VTTTRTRSRDRRDTRSPASREGAERRPLILTSAAVIIVLLAFGAAATSAGHVALAASQHFLLKYGGVFALIALTGAVVMGVIATDRIILHPGHRVLAQAMHRATSFGALAFLVIHIVLEITAKHLEESTTQHVRLLDAFIPFLSQYRTFYMAEGTIASDIIVLLVITSIVRRRFTSKGNAWKWRAIHYSSYAALVLGVLHGLLAGRKAIGSFVYWSYGAVIALVALAVLVRILATSLRSKDIVDAAAPLAESTRSGPMQSMPARAAALGLMGQLNGVMPLGGASQLGAATGAIPAIGGAGPATATMSMGPGSMGAPGGAPPAPQAIPAPSGMGRMPTYEPGYDGPPRYEGAPARPRSGYDAPAGRPQLERPSYDAPGRPAGPGGAGGVGGPGGAGGPGHPSVPIPVQPQAGRPAPPRQGYGTGPQPAYRQGTGPQPAYRPGQTGPQQAYRPGQTGPQPAYRPDQTGPQTGPQPPYRSQQTGPQQAYRPGQTGPQPAYRPERTGPQPAYRQGQTGPQPAYRPQGYDQDPGYGPGDGYGRDPGYGPPPGYGREAGYGPGSGYRPDDGYPGDVDYGAASRRPEAGYDGPPAYPAGEDRMPPGRPRRQRPPGPRQNGRTGPIPRVPSHGGDERR
jgi:DMSO/TMAO reductase YedYZ heme-binding membrane subunit